MLGPAALARARRRRARRGSLRAISQTPLESSERPCRRRSWRVFARTTRTTWMFHYDLMIQNAIFRLGAETTRTNRRSARVSRRGNETRVAPGATRVSSSVSGSARARCAARRRARTACASVGTRSPQSSRARVRVSRADPRGRPRGHTRGRTRPRTSSCASRRRRAWRRRRRRRRAGLARHPSAQNAGVFTVSSLRAAGGVPQRRRRAPEPHGHARHQPGGGRAPEHARRRGRRAEHRAGVRAAGRGVR